MTLGEFADRNGFARTTIRKIAYGQRQPSIRLATDIASATGGAVKVEDMLLPVTNAEAA